MEREGRRKSVALWVECDVWGARIVHCVGFFYLGGVDDLFEIYSGRWGFMG